MELESYKCSLEEHKEIDAIKYCQECNIYLCNKCEKVHLGLVKNHHHIFQLDKNIDELFTGFCKEKDHKDELHFFCKDHNELCCAACITKIKTRGYGKHSDCQVCDINEICEEKKKNLANNIKNLEHLSNLFQSLVNDLKQVFEEIDKNKDQVKQEIQKIFTQIRTELNNREDQLLIEVDKIFEKKFNNENVDNFLKEKKFPEKIKTFLEKGKNAEKNWEKIENKNILVNDCINIERTIDKINNMNELINSIKKLGTFDNEEKINQQEVNINIDDYNPQNLNCIKQITNNFGCVNNYICDGVCFFVSKKEEYVLGYIDYNSGYKSIIFYDINNNQEIKKLNNSHDNYICTIKHYPYDNYDMILSSSKYFNNFQYI